MAIEMNNDDVYMLTEIGYASVMYGLGDDVEPIFEALTLLYPENTAGSIGYAITNMNRGNFNGAIDILQGSMANCSKNIDEAKAILMLALFLGGRNDEAANLAGEVMNGNEGIVNTMANSLFQENSG